MVSWNFEMVDLKAAEGCEELWLLLDGENNQARRLEAIIESMTKSIRT
jgi:hypothetical protein